MALHARRLLPWLTLLFVLYTTVLIFNKYVWSRMSLRDASWLNFLDDSATSCKTLPTVIVPLP